MGFFSKKYNCTCIHCGAKYVSYYNEVNAICAECLEKRGWKGYAELRQLINDKLPGFTLDEWNEVEEKREQLLLPYKVVDGVTVDELRDAGTNYKSYTDEQCNRFIGRLMRSLIPAKLGGFYTNGFLMPSAYPGVVVNPKDVFAVALGAPYWKEKPADMDVVSIAFFTNDPAAPMFAVGEAFEVKGLSFKNKKARESLKEYLTKLCPNLTYPVMDYKEFKNIVKKERTVRGSISADIILKYVDRVDTSFSPFSITSTFISYNNGKLLNKYGYVYSDQVTDYLMADKKSRKFWGEKLKNSSVDGADVLAVTFGLGKFLVDVFKLMSKF